MTTNNDYSKFAGMQDLKKNKEERFRNVSMLRVKIEINTADGTRTSKEQRWYEGSRKFLSST